MIKRSRVRLVLPLIQVALAAALIASNSLRPNHVWDPAFTKPDWQFCRGLNAPAFLLAELPVHIAEILPWGNYQQVLIVQAIIRLSFVWLVWYAVSIEIGGGGQSVLSCKTPIRGVIDALAAIFGAIVGLGGGFLTRHIGGTNYARLVWVPHLIWAVAIMGFYGHDLWVSFRGVKEQTSI